MAETMTVIRIPGAPMAAGFMDYGVCTVEDTIATMRRHANHLRAELAAIDGASDADFQIDVVRGKIVQHHVRTLQTSSKKAA